MPLIIFTVLSSPFTAWFSLGPWLRLPVIFLILMAFVTLARISIRSLDKVKFEICDLLMFAFAAVCALSAFININHFVDKDTNNIIAIIFIVFAMYLIPKIYFENIISIDNITRLNVTVYITYLIVSTLVILDFILVNLFNYRIYDLFVFYRTGNADYFSRTGNLITPSGPAEEPATTAFFLNILFFLTLAYGRIRVTTNALLFLWHILCLAALGSSAGLIFFAFSVFISSLIYFKRQYLKWFAISAILLLILSPHVSSYFASISLLDKVLFKEENTSSLLRMHSWKLFYDSLFDGYKELLLGHSPAYSKLIVGTGFHSSYFTILSNYGLIAFIIFMLFLAKFFLTYVIKQNLYVLAAFLVILFTNTVADYYYQPIIWISLLIILINRKLKWTPYPGQLAK